MVSAAQSALINASLSPLAIGNAISSAIADKTLQAAKQEGAQLVQLIDSADSGSGSSGVQAGDALVARATGLGGMLDVVG